MQSLYERAMQYFKAPRFGHRLAVMLLLLPLLEPSMEVDCRYACLPACLSVSSSVRLSPVLVSLREGGREWPGRHAFVSRDILCQSARRKSLRELNEADDRSPERGGNTGKLTRVEKRSGERSCRWLTAAGIGRNRAFP